MTVARIGTRPYGTVVDSIIAAAATDDDDDDDSFRALSSVLPSIFPSFGTLVVYFPYSL